MPGGVEAVRFVINSGTRLKEKSSAPLSAHMLGLGIDFRTSPFKPWIDIKRGGVWEKDAINPEVRTQMLSHLIRSLKERYTSYGDVAATVEGKPPHLHVTILPKGFKALPRSDRGPKDFAGLREMVRAHEAGSASATSVPQGPATSPVPKIQAATPKPVTVPGSIPSIPGKAPGALPEARPDAGVQLNRKKMAADVVKGMVNAGIHPSDVLDGNLKGREWTDKYSVAFEKADYVLALALTWRQLNDDTQKLPGAATKPEQESLAWVRARIDECWKGFIEQAQKER